MERAKKDTCNIFLIGFMGAGKSRLAACLHEKYGLGVLEMDEEIEKQEQMSIPEIFERYGEKHFRELETELLKKLQKKRDMVVSCGGGVPMRAENVREMKKSGLVVLLLANPETILKRVRSGRERPLLNGHMEVSYIAELMEKRREKYKEAADWEIVTDGREPEDIARELMEYLGRELRENEEA